MLIAEKENIAAKWSLSMIYLMDIQALPAECIHRYQVRIRPDIFTVRYNATGQVESYNFDHTITITNSQYHIWNKEQLLVL